MEILINEKNTVEIVANDKSQKVLINEIENIYVSYNYFLFFKKYYLKIKTKNGIDHTIHISRKNKSRIKRQVCHFRILMNWTMKFEQQKFEFS